MDHWESQFNGIYQWIQKTSEKCEQSRQYPGLDISQMSEEEEYRLVISKIVHKPNDLIGIWLYILSERPYWKEDLRIELESRCKRSKYKGLWFELHRLLKIDHLDQAIFLTLDSIFSARTLRGNILPRALKLKKFVNYLKCKKKKPLYPEFHRGYRDKGSRRLVHTIHSAFEFSGENPEKLDFSDTIKKSRFLINFLYD